AAAGRRVQGFAGVPDAPGRQAGAIIGRWGMTRFSSLLLAALVLPLPAKAASYILYAGSYTAGTSKGIYAWKFDSKDGKIAPLGLMAQTPQAAHLWIAPNAKTLYTVNWEDKGG